MDIKEWELKASEYLRKIVASTIPPKRNHAQWLAHKRWIKRYHRRSKVERFFSKINV